MGVGKTVYKGEVETGVFAWFFGLTKPLSNRRLQSLNLADAREVNAILVGAGLLAKAVYQSQTCKLTHSLGEQARSHRKARRGDHCAEINSK